MNSSMNVAIRCCKFFTLAEYSKSMTVGPRLECGREIRSMASRAGMPPAWLCSRTFLAVKIAEGLACRAKPFQQSGRLPQATVLLLEATDPLENSVKAHCAGVPHRSTSVRGKAVAVDVDDVDIDGPQSDPLFQNLGTFVDEGVKGAFQDFFVCDPAPRNPCLASALRDELLHVRIGDCPSGRFFVAIPAAAGFLAKTAHLAQSIGHQRF